jgi:sugar lactone lactonase YvrE
LILWVSDAYAVFGRVGSVAPIMFLRRILPLFLMLAAFLPASVTDASFGQQPIPKTKVPSGDGGPATKASINRPDGLAIDRERNLFIVESQENRVRRVDARTGIITTIAGNGKKAFSGDRGLATDASLNYPLAAVVDKEGNLFVSDIGGRVRRINAKTRIITTVAGNGELGDRGAGDRRPAIRAGLSRPSDLALDNEENLYIADDLDHRIRRVDMKTGIITTVAGGGRSLGDGGSAIHARLNFPMGIAFDKRNNMFIADYQNNRIRRVDARTKVITTVAGNGLDGSSGDGGPAIEASVHYPSNVAVDDAGNLFLQRVQNNACGV